MNPGASAEGIVGGSQPVQLDIYEPPPNQLFRTIETTVNGVTKKILIPVMGNYPRGNDETLVTAPREEVELPEIVNVPPGVHVPIKIEPRGDYEMCDNNGSGLHIANVTSLQPFIEQLGNEVSVPMRNDSMVKNVCVDRDNQRPKGRGRGRWRRPAILQHPTGTCDNTHQVVTVEGNPNMAYTSSTIPARPYAIRDASLISKPVNIAPSPVIDLDPADSCGNSNTIDSTPSVCEPRVPWNNIIEALQCSKHVPQDQMAKIGQLSEEKNQPTMKQSATLAKKVDAASDNTKTMSVPMIQNPQLKDNETKMLVCVGQNNEGNYIYRSFDVDSDSVKLAGVPSNVNMVTNVLPGQTAPLSTGQPTPMATSQQMVTIATEQQLVTTPSLHQAGCSAAPAIVTPQVLSNTSSMVGAISGTTPLYTTGSPIIAAGNVSTNQLRCMRTADGQLIINLPAAPIGQIMAPGASMPFGNTGAVLQKLQLPAAPSNVVNFGQPAAPSNVVNIGQPAAPSNIVNFGQPVAPGNVVNIGQPAAPSNVVNFGQPAAPSNVVNFGQPAAPSNVVNFGQPAAPSNVVNIGHPSVQFIQNNMIGNAGGSITRGSSLGSPVQINHLPSSAPVHINPLPSSAPVQINSLHSSAPVQINPLSRSAPVQINPLPSSAPIQINPLPSSAPVQINPLPSSAPVELQILQTPSGPIIIQTPQNNTVSLQNAAVSTPAAATKPIVLGHCGKGPLVLSANGALTMQAPVPTITGSTSAISAAPKLSLAPALSLAPTLSVVSTTPALSGVSAAPTPSILKPSQLSTVASKVLSTVPQLMPSSCTKPSKPIPLQGYIDSDGKVHIIPRADAHNPAQLPLQPNQRYVISNIQSAPLKQSTPIAKKSTTSAPATCTVRPNKKIASKSEPSKTRVKSLDPSPVTSVSKTVINPTGISSSSQTGENTDSLVLCPITGLLKYPDDASSKLITKPIGEVDVNKLLEIAQGKTPGASMQKQSGRSKNTATVSPMRNILPRKQTAQRITPEREQKIKTLMVEDDDDMSDVEASLTTKQAPKRRRQTDVNIGRERMIRPKGDMRVVKVCDIEPDVEIMAQDQFNADDISLMRLNYTEGESPAKGVVTDVDSYDTDTSAESGSVAGYSIVRLMKQDLLRSVDAASSRSIAARDCLKPCIVLLKRLKLNGKIRVDLRTWNMAQSNLNRSSTRNKSSYNKVRSSNHRVNQRKKEEVLVSSDLSDLTYSTETSTDEDYFVTLRRQRKKRHNIANKDKKMKNKVGRPKKLRH